MFSKFAVVASLAILAVATPTPVPQSDQCNTGAIQCCQSVQSSSTPSVASLLTLLGVVAQGANVPVGLTCSPITGVGVSGSNCNASPVCCENNSFNGVVALGCTPVNVGL